MNQTEKDVISLQERQKSSERRLETIEKTLGDFIEGQHQQSLDWEKRYMEVVSALKANTEQINMLMKVSFLVLSISITHVIGAVVNSLSDRQSRPQIQDVRSK